MSNEYERDIEVEGTESDSVTVGSLPTQRTSSLWGGVQHRGVFDMFQRQDTMLSDAGDVASTPDPEPDSLPTPVHYVLHRVADGASFPLPSGVECAIGRGRMSDISVSDDPHLSRKHASIICLDEGAMISDLGSANGTWVDGKRLEREQRVKLSYGQSFCLSKSEFILLRETL